MIFPNSWKMCVSVFKCALLLINDYIYFFTFHNSFFPFYTITKSPFTIPTPHLIVSSSLHHLHLHHRSSLFLFTGVSSTTVTITREDDSDDASYIWVSFRLLFFSHSYTSIRVVCLEFQKLFNSWTLISSANSRGFSNSRTIGMITGNG